MSIINCGIYVMYFECDDEQYYVGKSGDMKARYKEHCRKLKSGIHVNKAMKKGYLAYGLPTMVPIEEILNLDNQSIREIAWIKELDTYHNGMNGTIGGDDLGHGADTPTSLYTREVYVKILEQLANTDKSLRSISDELSVSYSVLQKISNGSEHAWLSNEFPELWNKVKNKCGLRKGLVYNNNKYVEAMMLGMDANNTIKSIANTTELNESVVKNILYGINHTNLVTEYPEEYATMLANKGKRRKGTTNRDNYPDVLSPEKLRFSIINSNKFAIEHNLNPSHFHKLLKGKAISHNGWTLA